MARKDRVTYFYDSDFGQTYYGKGHPMKPHRLTMTHNLVIAYGLHEHMDVFKPRTALPAELAQFHSEEYVDFLAKVTPSNQHHPRMQKLMHKFNFNDDCPVFDDLNSFCSLYAGASIQGAQMLNHGTAKIAINWAGGLHHAKKAEASGFCYVNDLVLAIQELLKYHARVVYIDIDVHHGDGVEEAFYVTDRVMTVSFHMYGEYFFPGTGGMTDIGEHSGRGYSVNVPLMAGASDKTFHELFKPIMAKVMEVYKPGAIVLQCGADSLAADRLGNLGLSLKGHAEAVKFMKQFNLPMLVTGGGGYTKNNVARCWANETALLVGQEISDEIPDNRYREYFAPGYRLTAVPTRFQEDLNTKAEVERIKRLTMERLQHLTFAPSVGMHEVPPDAWIPEYAEFEEDGQTCGERVVDYFKEHNYIRESGDFYCDANNYGRIL